MAHDLQGAAMSTGRGSDRHCFPRRACRIRPVLGRLQNDHFTRCCGGCAGARDGRWCFGHRGRQILWVARRSLAARRCVVFGGSGRRQRRVVRRLSTSRNHLTGYASDALDGAALRRAIGFISGWLSKGAIRASARSVFPLADAAAAHAKLEQRAIQGRVVLIPRR